MKSQFTTAVAVFAALAGCLDGHGDDAERLEDGTDVDLVPLPPIEAGTFDGQSLMFQASDIQTTVARAVTVTPAEKQTCESSFSTRGNITSPAAIGWVIGRSPVRDYFSHTFIREAGLNGDVAATGLPGTIGETPVEVSAESGSTITLDAGEEMTYLLVASYAAGGAGAMSFNLTCPGRLTSARSSWSTSAVLFSDVSMNGTWTSVSVPGTARWEAQLRAEWAGQVPAAETLFLANEPIGGQLVLTTGSGAFTCGPAQDVDAAADGRAICAHEFPGGNARLEVTQASPGSVGQSGTADSWMGLLAQFTEFEWH